METNITTQRDILTIVAAGALALIAVAGAPQTPPIQEASPLGLAGASLVADEVVLPIGWGDIGARMAEAGAIDMEKLAQLYATRGGTGEEMTALLTSDYQKQIVMNRENAGELLNLFWAFGLSNKNDILENGPMADPRYGNPAYFASTGGWTIARGSAMGHYSAHPFITLSSKAQEKVEHVSKNIYRPCCNNPAYFPDCNHGMAMLGLLELMAANGVSEEAMYETALAVNSLWFPDTYAAIEKYLSQTGREGSVSAKDLLSAEYSGASGYQSILATLAPSDSQSDSSCGTSYKKQR